MKQKARPPAWSTRWMTAAMNPRESCTQYAMQPVDTMNGWFLGYDDDDDENSKCYFN